MDTARLKTRLTEMAAEARSAVEEEEMEPGGWDRGWTLVSALDAVRAEASELARYDEAVERLLNSKVID